MGSYMTRYFGVHTLEGEWHSLLPRYVLLSDRVQGKRILDIGCGTGIGSSLLLEMGAEQVNAIDHRPAVLELARVKHAKEGLDFHVMFWEELDFPDDSFDMVLCLDPTSPVTDPSLLLEIKRVLKIQGEYVCAIEHRNIEGIESLLPRYGYNNSGEDIPLTRNGERVPQLGQLGQFFETITTVTQRPRYSFVFDFATVEGKEPSSVRKIGTDESGLWIGDDPRREAKEQTDQRPGRWISADDMLCARDGDPASVNVLFCGDSHMPPPSLREVEMPYMGLVDRLHKLISDLQINQHPSAAGPTFGDVIDRDDDEPLTMEFSTRERTNEFFAVPPSSDVHSHGAAPPRRADSAFGLGQIRDQLEQMTGLYQQMRCEMETLFQRTRQELVERDRYIEQLVDTVHSWQHHFYRETGSLPVEAGHEHNPFDSEPTRIFSREEINLAEKSDALEVPEHDGHLKEPSIAPPEDGLEQIASSEKEDEKTRTFERILSRPEEATPKQAEENEETSDEEAPALSEETEEGEEK